MHGEKGQALPLAIMVLALGALVISPFLGHAGSSLIGSRVYADTIRHQGSCDAGIEHAIWWLTWGGLTELIPDDGDQITYPLGEELNGLTTMITVTASISGGGSGVAGEIEDAPRDTLIFDDFYGYQPDIINVSGDVFAIVYQGYWNQGYIRTVAIDGEGEIGYSVLDSYVFEYSSCDYPVIVRVSEDVFAIAYQGYWNPGYWNPGYWNHGNQNPGYIQTLRITADGDIGGVLDTWEFDNWNGQEPDMIHISGDVYAVAYRGDNNDGWLLTVTIDANGNIASHEIDDLKYDSSYGYTPDIIHVSDDTYAIAYRGSGGDGYIRTLSITSSGQISSHTIDSLEFDNKNCDYPNIINVSGNTYAVAYQGNGNGGYIRTVRIDADGDIGGVIDTWEFDNRNGQEPVIIGVSGDIFAIVYRGQGNDGWVLTAAIAANGSITDDEIDTLEYDNSSGLTPAIIHVSGGIFAIAYQGPWSRGYLKTIAINTDAGSASYEITATTGTRTITATVSLDGETPVITSWEVE